MSLCARPCRIREGLFACYDGFVFDLDARGSPTSEPIPFLRCLPHTVALLTAAKRALVQGEGGEPGAPLPDLPCCLLGFSKGSCVLNEFVGELRLLRGCPPSRMVDDITRFLARVTALHWIDGMGHVRLVPSTLVLKTPTLTPPPTDSPLVPLVTPPMATPLPWYDTVAVTIPTEPPEVSRYSPLAGEAGASGLCLHGLPPSCRLYVHGSPYQWDAGDIVRAVKKTQAQWLVDNARALGYKAHLLVRAVIPVCYILLLLVLLVCVSTCCVCVCMCVLLRLGVCVCRSTLPQRSETGRASTTTTSSCWKCFKLKL